MDGGDCAESGAGGKDCGKSYCHNNTIIFHPVYAINNTYASEVCGRYKWVHLLHFSNRPALIGTNDGCL